MTERLNEDIVSAQQIVAAPRETSEMFNSFSIIYRGTNEAVSNEIYQDLLKDRERVLTITASGDQLLNSILLGCQEITCVDISRLTKYYAMLKLAAIQTLTKEEYLEFFTGKLNEDLLSYELYEKVREELDEDATLFWDSLYNYYDEVEINESCLFSHEVMNRGIMLRNNPYLDGDNYEKTKAMIRGAKISFRDGNIYQMFHNSPTYDLVNLSNIIEYTKNRTGYREFVERLPLREDGVALSYVFDYKGTQSDSFKQVFDGNGFKVKELVKQGPSNGLLIYKRP